MENEFMDHSGKITDPVKMREFIERGAEENKPFFTFQTGWAMDPKGGMEEVLFFLRMLGIYSHIDWRRAINQKKIPDEDVSPSEGFFLYEHRKIYGKERRKEK